MIVRAASCRGAPPGRRAEPWRLRWNCGENSRQGSEFHGSAYNDRHFLRASAAYAYAPCRSRGLPRIRRTGNPRGASGLPLREAVHRSAQMMSGGCHDHRAVRLRRADARRSR
ncbi:hypothetical protein T261_1031 [Streptomyces lydicus]|nr:hypothetical protein T261_1031 [Streptomyces lydicus]